MILRSLVPCPDSLSDSWNDQGLPVLQLKGPSLAKSTKSKQELLVQTGTSVQKFCLVNFIWKSDSPKCELVLLLYLLKKRRQLELVKYGDQ